jgi:translocation and assembly module TamB
VVVKAMGDSLGPLLAPLLANAPPRPAIDSVIARAKDAAFAASLDASGAIRNPNGHAALLLDFPAEKGFGKAVLHATAHRDRDTLRAMVRADLEHASAPIVIEAKAPLTMNLERGTVSLPPDAPLAGKVAIDAFELGLLEPYLPDDVELAGPLDLNATISGTRAAPRAQGRVELGGGRVAHKAYGLEIDSLRIAADFDEDRITLHEASGKTEKGHLRLSGGVPVQGGGGDSLAGALEITGLTLRTPHGAVAEGGAALAVSGAIRRPLLRGRIVLTKATIPVPERNRKVVRIPADDPWLLGSKVGSPAKTAKVSRRLPVDLDLEVDVPRNLWLENKNIDVEIGGNLKLTTPEAMLRITGELKARQGSVRLLRRRFEVTKGTVTFFGGEVIAPEIDIEAETEVNTTTVTIHLTGSVAEPRLEFKSDPVLEQGDIVSLLVIGRTSDELSSGERSLVGDQARTVAANYVSRELEAQLGSELGLDLVEIDTGGEQDRVSVGKYVTSRTLLRVYQQFGSEAGGGIMVEYALTDDFDLQVSAEDDGENGIDLLWQPR